MKNNNVIMVKISYQQPLAWYGTLDLRGIVCASGNLEDYNETNFDWED